VLVVLVLYGDNHCALFATQYNAKTVRIIAPIIPKTIATISAGVT